MNIYDLMAATGQGQWVLANLEDYPGEMPGTISQIGREDYCIARACDGDLEETALLIIHCRNNFLKALAALKTMNATTGCLLYSPGVPEKCNQALYKSMCRDFHGTKHLIKELETVEPTKPPVCEYCDHVADADHCRARSSDPSWLICTRVKGHSGPHVACGNVKHNLKTWS